MSSLWGRWRITICLLNLNINLNPILALPQNPHLRPLWRCENRPKCPHSPEISSLSRSKTQKKHTDSTINLLDLLLFTPGRDLCEDVEPSSGGFVRCTSTSSLDDICQANKHSELTWWAAPKCFCMHWAHICTCVPSLSYQCLSTSSLVEPNSNPAPQPMTESCSSEYQKDRHPLSRSADITVVSAAVTAFVCASGEAPRFCDCTAFCNSTSKKRARIRSSCMCARNCTAKKLYSCAHISLHTQLLNVMSTFVNIHLTAAQKLTNQVQWLRGLWPINSLVYVN